LRNKCAQWASQYSQNVSEEAIGFSCLAAFGLSCRFIHITIDFCVMRLQKAGASAFSFLLIVVLLPVLTFRAPAQKQTAPEAPAHQAPLSGVRRDSLLNGLQIVTFDARSPRVRCDLVIRGGAMFDLTGKTGLAALTQETLLAVNPRLVEEIETLEGSVSWGVTYDESWYRLEVPAKNLETALEILGRLLVTETIRPDAFKRAREAQLEKIRKLEESLTPAMRADRAFRESLFGQHPYSRSIEGTAATVNAIIQGDVFEFYRRLYIANDSFVVVAGPVALERVMKAFRVLFGAWIKGPVVPPTFRPPARTTELNLVKVNVADAPRVELRGGLIGVSTTDKDFVVTQVMARALESRLKQSKALVASDSVSARAEQRVLPGPIYFSASVSPERAPEVSRAATDAFAAFASTLVPEGELAAAKASLKGEKAERSMADQLHEVESFGLAKNVPLVWSSRIDGITSADIQRVAKRLLEANALTVVVLGPASAGM
jgi:zinc protease